MRGCNQMGNKRNRNKQPVIVQPVNFREKVIADLRRNGFEPQSMTEFDLALLTQIGLFQNEVVEAIDEVGATIEDCLVEPEDEGPAV